MPNVEFRTKESAWSRAQQARRPYETVSIGAASHAGDTAVNADNADMIRSRSSCFARALPRATEAHGIDESEQFVERGIAYRRRRRRFIQRHDARAANLPLMLGQSSGSDAPNSAESSPAGCAVGSPRDSAPASAGKAYATMEPRNSSTAVRSSCSATAMS